jgi:hypothetical protein
MMQDMQKKKNKTIFYDDYIKNNRIIKAQKLGIDIHCIDDIVNNDNNDDNNINYINNNNITIYQAIKCFDALNNWGTEYHYKNFSKNGMGYDKFIKSKIYYDDTYSDNIYIIDSSYHINYDKKYKLGQVILYVSGYLNNNRNYIIIDDNKSIDKILNIKNKLEKECHKNIIFNFTNYDDCIIIKLNIKINIKSNSDISELFMSESYCDGDFYIDFYPENY